MFNRTARLSLLLATILLPAACTLDDTASTSRAIIATPCATAADCPTGFECEIEVEHDVTTSFCQASDDSEGTCPAGYEAEVEHGQLYCQPHGGSGGGSDDDGGVGTGSDDDGGLGTGVTGAACTTAADCAAGLECEVEVEHGQTLSTCQPHGGV